MEKGRLFLGRAFGMDWYFMCKNQGESVAQFFFTLCGGLGVVVFGFCQFGVPCGFLFAFCHVDNAFFHLF